MTLEQIKGKLSEMCPGIVCEEVIKDDSVSVYATVDSTPFRESVYGADPGKALVETYGNLYWRIREYRDDPEGKGRKIRAAFMDSWIENVANGVGDANGETIPSIKQVRDKLNGNDRH